MLGHAPMTLVCEAIGRPGPGLPETLPGLVRSRVREPRRWRSGRLG
jgi:hypothetical protein